MPVKRRTKIPLPKCPICQNPYSDHSAAATPLLLHCGHSFCHDCLSRMLSSSSSSSSSSSKTTAKPSLSCPKCRHVSPVGNSLLALPKNFSLLSSLLPSRNDASDSDSDSDSVDGDRRWTPPSSCGGNICRGHELRILRGLSGVKWRGLLVKRKECRHSVVVRRVRAVDVADADWVERELDSLRNKSMWCRNVCGFQGVVKTEEDLCIVTQRCLGSVESQMHRNGGRLTLEQVLRY